MKKLVIIHFQPLEYYPPIQNIIDYISYSNNKIKLLVCSSKHGNYLPAFTNENVLIKRFGRIDLTNHFIVRLIKYLYFNICTLFQIIYFRPEYVFYFESISAFPAIIYKRFINRKCSLLIHYHEYTSLMDYQKEMLLVRILHKLEIPYYKKSIWLSHTNKERLNLFINDYKIDDYEGINCNVIPNYPPKNWLNIPKKSSEDVITKIVYVGSLSLDTMYTREFSYWVSNKAEIVQWDLYAYNVKNDVLDFFNNLGATNINLYEGIDYKSIPNLLKNYDIGIILYKGHTLNYIYNAPNKLFEYYACGLDVWFPDEMLGCYEYVKENVYPKVLKINFNVLSDYNFKELTSIENKQYLASPYFCEDVYQNIIDFLVNEKR